MRVCRLASVLLVLVCETGAVTAPPASKLRRWSSFFRTERHVKVHNAPGAPLWPETAPLKVLTWNVQYAADVRQHFFYDGGMAVAAPRNDVELTLRNLAATIRELDPDVVSSSRSRTDSSRTDRRRTDRSRTDRSCTDRSRTDRGRTDRRRTRRIALSVIARSRTGRGRASS